MPGIRAVFIVLVTICMIAVYSNETQAEAIRWPDYLTPLHNITVLFEDEQKIFVDLPDEFLTGKDVLFRITLLSQMAVMDSGNRHPSFRMIKPSLRFNKSTRAEYRIPAEDFPGVQQFELRIKTRHLHPGKNLVKVVFEWEGLGECHGDNCRFVVLDMCFKDNASLDEPWKSSPGQPSDVPQESTKLEKSNLAFYDLWYDPEKWTPVFVEERKKENIDFRLVHNIEGNYITSIAYQDSYSSSAITTFVENTLSKIVPEGEIVWKKEISRKDQQIHYNGLEILDS